MFEFKFQMLLILCALSTIGVDARTSVAQDGSSDYDYDQMVDDESGERNVLHDAGDAWGRFYGGQCINGDQCADVISFCNKNDECHPQWWFWLLFFILLALIIIWLICCICGGISGCLSDCCTCCCK